MTGRITLAIAIITFTTLSACKKDEKKEPAEKPVEPPVAAPDAAKAAEPTPTPTPPAGPKGRKADGNDAKLVELSEGMLACTPDPMYPANACRDQFKPINEAFDKANPAHVATAINLLEDEDAKIRLLSAMLLSDHMLMQGAEARKHQARVAAAAAAETDPTVAGLLGPVLLQGDFKDTAYADAIEKLAGAHALPELRAAVISNLAVQDPRYTAFLQGRYDAETDPKVKEAIVMAFYTAPPEVCPWKLATFMAESDVALAGKLGYTIVWNSGGCQPAYDSFIAAYAEKVQTITPDFTFVLDTNYMARAQGATPEQIKAFLDAAKKIVENTAVSGMARAAVLKEIIAHHPEGKAYAKGFEKDSDSFVADAAKGS